ncbi:MAG: tetratricopeptide repeat protein [Bacteroidales bacterium]|nr:tetratricopeptide repeat protein [Bacteroidales bacterium]
MPRNLFLLIALSMFVLTATYSQSQSKIDSLISITSTSALDTNLVKTYERISRLYLKIQLDSAKIYATKMLALSKELNYDKGIAMGNNWLGEANLWQGNYKEALNYFKKTNETFGKKGETTMWAHSLQVMANVYNMTNNGDSAFLLYNQALAFYTKNKDAFSEAKVKSNLAKLYSMRGDYTKAAQYLYAARFTFSTLKKEYWFVTTENEIAVLYSRMHKYDSAISVYDRVIDFYKQSDDYFNLGESYSNLGVLYEGKEQFEKALASHKKSLAYRYLVNDQRGIAVTQMNIASVFINIGQYDSVLTYLDNSSKIFRAINTMHPLVFNLTLTGNYYTETGQFHKASEAYQEAYSLAKKNNLKDYAKDAANSLSKTYEQLGDYKNALLYARIYKAEYDSLINEENIKQQTVAEENYKHKLLMFDKEKEIMAEKQQKNNLIFSATAILIILILLLFYGKRLQKNKIIQIQQLNQINLQETKLRTQKTERERVSNILHDNIAHLIINTQQKISRLIEKISDAQLNKTLIQAEENLELANKMAKVASYELAFSYVLEKSIVDQFEQYIARIRHSQTPEISFQHSEKTLFETLDDEIKINLFSAFQELLGNAIKYSKAGHINISLFNDGAKTVLQVEDNGIGFDYNQVRHGQGLSSMQERAEKLNGNFTIESESGFGSKMKFIIMSQKI